MVTLHHHRHHRHRLTFSFATAVAFLLLALVSSSARVINPPCEFSNSVGVLKKIRVVERVLMGSSPPTCRSKCGNCAPCEAVHVPVQPGRWVLPLEYYPEAWRCKCGNTLFMP